MARKAPMLTTDPSEPEQVEASEASGSLDIEIARIQPYERNPRHGLNPEYDRIKDSIRSNGLDQPLVITQRPDATDYIVHAGGNTRLMVLKELFDESGDPRYAQVPCVFRPWNRESDVLLAHLRENDLRGSLTFIDKACAVFEARKLLAEEFGLDDMSQRRLETELRRAGYRITHARISQMEYAVYRLLPVMPLALEQGLGRPHVERIRRLERAAYTIWRERCSEPGDDFEEIFVTLCRRYDGLDWDTDVLRGALESEIAEALDANIHTVRVMLDAELAGREWVIPAIGEEPEEESRETESGIEHMSETDVAQEAGDLEFPDASLAPVDEVPQAVSDSPDPVEVPDPNPGRADDGVAETYESVTEMLDAANDTVPGDLKSLRGRAWTLAARLAQRNGMGELVEPVSGGLGFVLRDVPDPTLADQLDEDSLSQLSMLWWQLAACAEVTFAPLESIPMHVPLGIAVSEFLAETEIPAITHHHDFYWERTRYQISAVYDYLEMAFPPRIPRLQHVVINQAAREDLAWRKGVTSVLIPNVLDFDNSPPPVDDYARDVRRDMGLEDSDKLILQPTRIVPRKGIEHTIALLRRLADSRCKLVISHEGGDEGCEYQSQLEELARDEGVDLRLFGDRVAERRQLDRQGRKIYVIEDLYPHADLVCFPSLYECFGNAFLEAVYFRVPILVNRYDVFVRDIEPKGFRLPTIEGFINRRTVSEVRRLLDDEDYRTELVNHNYEVARKYYGYRLLRYGLQTLIRNIHQRTD